jgi:hypothetical protein
MVDRPLKEPRDRSPTAKADEPYEIIRYLKIVTGKAFGVKVTFEKHCEMLRDYDVCMEVRLDRRLARAKLFHSSVFLEEGSLSGIIDSTIQRVDELW